MAGSWAVTNNSNVIIITINGAGVPVRSVSKSSEGRTTAPGPKYLDGEPTWFMLLVTPACVCACVCIVLCHDMSECLPGPSTSGLHDLAELWHLHWAYVLTCLQTHFFLFYFFYFFQNLIWCIHAVIFWPLHFLRHHLFAWQHATADCCSASCRKVLFPLHLCFWLAIFLHSLQGWYIITLILQEIKKVLVFFTNITVLYSLCTLRTALLLCFVYPPRGLRDSSLSGVFRWNQKC